MLRWCCALWGRVPRGVVHPVFSALAAALVSRTVGELWVCQSWWMFSRQSGGLLRRMLSMVFPSRCGFLVAERSDQEDARIWNAWTVCWPRLIPYSSDRNSCR